MANQASDILNERQEHSVRRVSSFAASSQTAKSLKEALKGAEQIRLELAGRALATARNGWRRTADDEPRCAGRKRRR